MSAPRSDSLGMASRSSWKGVLAAPDRYQLYARKAGLHRAAGENSAADNALRRARALRPDEPRLLFNAANLWLATGLPGDPIRALRRALCVEPDFIAAADRLVLLNKALGDRGAATRGARRGMCRRAGARTGPLLELILLLSDEGDRSEAIALMGLALAEMVGSPADLRALFQAAKRMGGSKLLVRAVQFILCDTPNHTIAARELASTPVKDDSEWPTRAILSRLRYALPLDPVISNGAGVYLENRDRADEALRHYVKALVLDPALSISIFNVAVQARYAGDFTRAAVLFERALMIGPDDPVYQYNLGHVLLATGHSRRGLALYESRWTSGERQSHRRGGPTPSFSQPMLKELDADVGEAEASLLIWGEQGLGDEIWFAGYAPRLGAGRRMGRRTVLECDWRLTGLFDRSGLANTVITRMDPPHPEAMRATRQVAAGSLPFLTERALGQTEVAPFGYLKVDPTRAAALRQRLAAFGDGPTIGLSWRSTKSTRRLSFEAPLAQWRPVLEIPGATFVNLQYDADPEEIAEVRARTGVRIVELEDLDPRHDIDELAALISILDHVVSVANVTVPLCHGLGRVCHVALRHYQEDWRYRRDHEESTWLPGCALYWRSRDGGWNSVFERIADRLMDGGHCQG